MLRRLWIGVAAAALLSAQHGVKPKPTAAEYPAHARAGEIDLGAEYLVRSVGSGNEMYVVPDYLTVLVAVYPPKGGRAEVDAGRFFLRINAKKSLLSPQAPQMVAAGLKYPDWEIRPNLEVGAGMGDRGVVLGRRPRVERFPGDQRPAETRPAGTVTQPGGEARPAEELVVQAALPEGPASGPVAGYMYFAFKGKPKSIKSLELIYESGQDSATLRFF